MIQYSANEERDVAGTEQSNSDKGEEVSVDGQVSGPSEPEQAGGNEDASYHGWQDVELGRNQSWLEAAQILQGTPG